MLQFDRTHSTDFDYVYFVSREVNRMKVIFVVLNFPIPLNSWDHVYCR